MFEAREFMRKKLIGQSVHVTVDYIQPAQDNYPEKICGTVTIGGVNVAEALVSKGKQWMLQFVLFINNDFLIKFQILERKKLSIDYRVTY